jgi:hypothetical protein
MCSRKKPRKFYLEIEQMWNVKTEEIPVIIGATGTISKSFRKYFSSKLGRREVKELQKNSYIGHSTHTAGSVNVEAQNIQHGK